MIGIEEKLNQLILAQEQAMNVARSYYQHLDAYGLPPEELYREFKMYRESGAFCNFCTPSLVMIPSPACYEQNRDFWPSYFRVEHNIRDKFRAEHPFEGIRGAYFPFQFHNQRQHFDVVEMDNPSYFNSLDDEEKTDLMRRFFTALQLAKMHRSNRLALSGDIQDRSHITFCQEAYIGFTSRAHPTYNLKVDKIVTMDLAPYRIYQRDYPVLI